MTIIQGDHGLATFPHNLIPAYLNFEIHVQRLFKKQRGYRGEQTWGVLPAM